MTQEAPAPEAEQPQEQVTPEIAAPEVEKPEEKKAEEVQPEKLVRLEALHEERGKRKELAKQLEAEKRARAEFEARMQERINALYQPQPQQVDPNDPIAVQQNEIQQHRSFLQQIAQERQNAAFHEQEQRRVSALVNWAKNEAQEFKTETPDFQDAYNHVASQRANQLKAMGLDPQGIQQAMVRDELWVYEHAYQTGKNPGQVIYEMAKNTGYKPKGTSPEEKMDALQKGVKASQTLSGGSVSDRPTAAQIADMSPSDFEAFKKKLAKEGKRLSDVL